MVGNEEERLIFLNWSTGRDTEDVALKHGPARTGSFQEWIAGIERLVAEVLIGNSVKIVRAAPGNYLNIASTSTPER